MKILRCTPTPTDAELEAERDRKHQQEVQQWLNGQQCVCGHPRHTGLCVLDGVYEPHYCRCNQFRAAP